MCISEILSIPVRSKLFSRHYGFIVWRLPHRSAKRTRDSCCPSVTPSSVILKEAFFCFAKALTSYQKHPIDSGLKMDELSKFDFLLKWYLLNQELISLIKQHLVPEHIWKVLNPLKISRLNTFQRKSVPLCNVRCGQFAKKSSGQFWNNLQLNHQIFCIV